MLLILSFALNALIGTSALNNIHHAGFQIYTIHWWGEWITALIIMTMVNFVIYKILGE